MVDFRIPFFLLSSPLLFPGLLFLSLFALLYCFDEQVAIADIPVPSAGIVILTYGKAAGFTASVAPKWVLSYCLAKDVPVPRLNEESMVVQFVLSGDTSTVMFCDAKLPPELATRMASSFVLYIFRMNWSCRFAEPVCLVCTLFLCLSKLAPLYSHGAVMIAAWFRVAPSETTDGGLNTITGIMIYCDVLSGWVFQLAVIVIWLALLLKTWFICPCPVPA